MCQSEGDAYLEFHTQGKISIKNDIIDKQKLKQFITQTIKDLPAMQETPVQSLGREDPLEKEMATHSSTLA